ncbi:hypothetical protein T08_668, partial [Trichinella sp. T8]
LFYNLHGTTAWFACVVVYVDRTVGFSLSNLIQMWRQTLNQGAFRVHCIVKLEKFSNSTIMESFDSKFFRLPL